jgi:hypothetical protein
MAKTLTPLGALWRGVVAGLAGSVAQDLFFRLTSRIAPKNPAGAFEPPEEKQKKEQLVETVARRFVEGMAARGPLTEAQKKRAGQAVHYSFGAGWGAAYAMTRESWPEVRRPAGVVGFSTTVWLVGDNLILKTFRLAAGPSAYPPKVHAYAWVAHLVYGGTVAAVYNLLKRVDLGALLH